MKRRTSRDKRVVAVTPSSYPKPVRVLRDDVVIHQGELDSLRRFKDDVGEVKNGTECGVGIRNYKDIKPGDKIEVYDRKEEAQSL